MISEFKEFSKSYISNCQDDWEINMAQKISSDIVKKIKSLKPGEQQDYLFCRNNTAKASVRFLNDDLSYVGGTDGTINYYCIEKEMLSGFIKEQGYTHKGKTVFKDLNDPYVKSITSLAEPYGYSKRDIAFELDKKIAQLLPAQM